MNEPEFLQTLLQQLRKGKKINVESTESSWKVLSYKDGKYFQDTPEGKKEIDPEEASRCLSLIGIIRIRKHWKRRGQRKEEMKQ